MVVFQILKVLWMCEVFITLTYGDSSVLTDKVQVAGDNIDSKLGSNVATIPTHANKPNKTANIVVTESGNITSKVALKRNDSKPVEENTIEHHPRENVSDQEEKENPALKPNLTEQELKEQDDKSKHKTVGRKGVPPVITNATSTNNASNSINTTITASKVKPSLSSTSASTATASTTSTSTTTTTTSTTTTTTRPPVTTTKKPKKPTVTTGSEDDPEEKLSTKMKKNSSVNADAQLLGGHHTNTNYVVPIIAVILSVPLVAIVASVLYKRGSEWWQHRHYRRMDFLIDGMYNN